MTENELTLDNAIQIKELYQGGIYEIDELADMFNTTVSVIEDVLFGDAWKGIENEYYGPFYEGINPEQDPRWINREFEDDLWGWE